MDEGERIIPITGQFSDDIKQLDGSFSDLHYAILSTKIEADVFGVWANHIVSNEMVYNPSFGITTGENVLNCHLIRIDTLGMSKILDDNIAYKLELDVTSSSIESL